MNKSKMHGIIFPTKWFIDIGVKLKIKIIITIIIVLKNNYTVKNR